MKDKFRAAFVIAAASVLLAGCADTMNHDDGRWFVTHHGEETDYEMQDQVLFQLDSAEISSRAYDILREVASDARRRPRLTVEVDGYTDTSGAHRLNMELSQARAQHVADILARQGVEPRRIVARGFGETRLAVQTPDGVREARNRRVVIRLLPPR